MITADIHMHSSFSGDSDEPMENMIQSAISKGLTTICFTEHLDIDYPVTDETPEGTFILDTSSYYRKFIELKDKYSSLKLLFGVEIGLQPHLSKEHSEFIKQLPYDFIIGSEHITNQKDPYYPSFYADRSEYEAYSEYFEDIITNLKAFSNIDSFGHLDYVVRYGPNTNKDYSYLKYSDYIDSILNLLVANGIALEINSAGYKYGLGAPNPCKDIVCRYKELGGELITVGSDAHDKNRIAADFDKVEALLKSCGYNYYCIYKNRKPTFVTF